MKREWLYVGIVARAAESEPKQINELSEWKMDDAASVVLLI